LTIRSSMTIQIRFLSKRPHNISQTNNTDTEVVHYMLCFQSSTLNRSPILIFCSTTLSLSDLVRPVKYMARYRNIQLMC
jgi:hypothetical protein